MADFAFRLGRGSRMAITLLLATFVATPVMAQPKGAGGGWKPKPPPDAAPPPEPPPPLDPAAQAEATAKEEARKHFDQGLALFDRGSLEAAYPEFEKSISIYPTRAAIKNAALCLRRMNRFAEAVDMNERLLAYNGVSEEEKGIANAELAQLRPVVGNIIVDGVQSGATVTIDSKPVGTTPLKGPLHVPVGTRIVRILKAGFETFEQRVEAAGGKEVTVRAVLAPLELSGWLLVEEASGYNVDVILDGVVVGKTPWRGLIATGEHLVVLRGDKRQGTQPARIEVRQSQVTNMLVIAEELASDLKVQSQIKGGEIRVDGVFVGRDAWEGRVRAGSHRVEIGGNGYALEERRVEVAAGKTEVVSFAPTVEAPRTFWEENPPFIEAGGAFGIGPGFGGIAKDCAGCNPVIGGMGTLRGGLSIRNRWTVGFDLGFLHTGQTVENRTAIIEAFGIVPNPGQVKDDLVKQGFTAGFGVGVKFGDRFPIGIRLGAGGFFGSFTDRRTGKIAATGKLVATQAVATGFKPNSYDVDVEQSFTMTAFYVMPEIRFGVRVRKNLDVMLSLGGMLLISPDSPKWVPEDGIVTAGTDGLANFQKETLADRVQFVGTPALLVNYRF
jgi:hypothetical protein